MNELIIVIQTALSVYAFYLLIVYKERPSIIYIYLIASLYFLVMKFEIINFTEGTTLNYWAWWIVNCSIYWFIIYYINKKNGKLYNNFSNKN